MDEVVEELQTEPRWSNMKYADLRKQVAGIMGQSVRAGGGVSMPAFESTGVYRNGRLVYRMVS